MVLIVSLDEAKEYLRVDSSDEDALIGTLLATAQWLCADVARLDEDKMDVITGVSTSDDSVYTDEELVRIQSMLRTAILYTLGYLFEYREQADHHALTITLRNLLFELREGVL